MTDEQALTLQTLMKGQFDDLVQYTEGILTTTQSAIWNQKLALLLETRQKIVETSGHAPSPYNNMVPEVLLLPPQPIAKLQSYANYAPHTVKEETVAEQAAHIQEEAKNIEEQTRQE